MHTTACAKLAGAVFLVLSIPLVAHHGAASFDNEKTLTLKGTVTEWLWANPHCFLKVDVKDDSGAVRNWNLELGNPTDITPAGYRRTMFKAGDHQRSIGSAEGGGTVQGEVTPPHHRLSFAGDLR